MSISIMHAMIVALQSSIAMSDTIIIGILTVAASAASAYVAGKTGAAEWKGGVNQKFANIETKFGEIDEDQSEQWSEIRKSAKTVATLDGQVSQISQIARRRN